MGIFFKLFAGVRWRAVAVGSGQKYLSPAKYVESQLWGSPLGC